VLSVSSKFSAAGDTHAIINVREFPPAEMSTQIENEKSFCRADQNSTQREEKTKKNPQYTQNTIFKTELK
jgi:hypothetical protein